MFDPQPGEFYRHDDHPNITVQVIGPDPISEKIAPCVNCVAYDDGHPTGTRSIWMDILHNHYTRVS